MKRLFSLLFITLLFQTAAWAQAKQPQIEVSLKHPGDAGEISTERQLRRLLNQYDLSKWIFTKKIIIDRDTAIPHSHPVLTLNTEFLKNDELFISTFVHEQIHWFLEEKKEQTEKAIAELKTVYPKVPVGRSGGGARNEYSTYLHLINCYLEYRALKELLGESKARRVIEFLTTDHYTWIYKQMLLDEGEKIGAVVEKYKLTI